MANGDGNTNFFHKFAPNRRNHKAIWDLQNSEGVSISSQKELKAEALNFFSSVYKDLGSQSIDAHMHILGLFPRFFDGEEGINVGSPVTLEEIEKVLKIFSKDKSPGRDGWLMEFFLAFFELMGTEILHMVEESRMKGFVSEALNSTFITLIPKCVKPSTFNDFRTYFSLQSNI